MKIMEEYSVAFAEVSEILKIFPEEELNKIPKSFIDLIERCKNANYKYELEEDVELHNQKMTSEAKTILSVIYRDYICTEEEREELIKEEKNEDYLREEQKRIKYNPNNIFKENKIDNKPNVEELASPKINNTDVLIELKWYEKIIIKIKEWLSKI